jgi:hypothetical protein
LGAYYILSALTLVSMQAADALPWLYESVLWSDITTLSSIFFFVSFIELK